MTGREEALKNEVAEWNKAMEISAATAAEKAQLHDKIVNELKDSRREAVENAKKEASRADNAEQTIRDLQKEKNDLSAEKDDLSAERDLLKSELQMLKDLQDKMIDDAKEEAIDNAWYRMWSTNPLTLDLEFMGDELEPALARWNARLALEQLEAEAADAETVDEDGGDNDAIASALKTGSSRSEEIAREIREAYATDDRAIIETEPAASPNELPVVEDAPATEPWPARLLFFSFVLYVYPNNAFEAKTMLFFNVIIPCSFF